MRLGKEYTPSAETIKQMHTPGGKAAKMPDPIVLGMICSLYNEPVEAVSPEVATLLRVLKQRLGRSIDLRELGRACNHPNGYIALRLFDPDGAEVVIDLRDHVVANVTQIETQDLYARAS